MDSGGAASGVEKHTNWRRRLWAICAPKSLISSGSGAPYLASGGSPIVGGGWVGM